MDPSRSARLAEPRTLAAWVMAVVLLLGLAANALLHRGPLERLDVRVAFSLNHLIRAHPAAISFWRFVTRAGSPVAWDIVAGVVVVVLLALRRRRLAALGVASLTGAAVLSSVLKTIVGRPRPDLPVSVDHAGGMSFPSGHAMTSLVAVGFLLVVARQLRPRLVGPPLLTVSMIVVATVGFSRLILGVHFLTDVLGGWLAGGLWLLAVGVLLRVFVDRPA